MKLCIDCKHWEGSSSTTATVNFDKCTRLSPPTPEVSMVTGKEIKPKPVYAEDERKYGACGRDAKYFEPQEKESANAPF